MKFISTLILFLILSTMANSEIITSDVDYKIGDVTLQGYAAYDNSLAGKRPGILIVHQWKGLTEYEKMRARQLAELGYYAFAVDIYGKGVRPENPKDAGELSGKFAKDRPLFRERLMAGFDEMKMQSLVDANNVAAIGYCFGGGGVLELARTGADLKANVSFHGSLKNPNPQDAQNIKGRVLILHGAIDPFVPEDDVIAFKKEMEDAKIDYVLTEYSGAVHSFTLPNAGSDISTGSAYNEKADKRSWDAMRKFFEDVFPK